MFKYAEIYAGRVRDIRESNLNYTDFCSIWSPSNFWLDVTGIENIGIGWLIKSNTEVGIYFEEVPAYKEQTFEDRKAGKLELLKAMFVGAGDSAYIESSLGFTANAGDRALIDINGLIAVAEESSEEIVIFCDFNNIMHPIALDELKTLKIEIIKNGQYLYQQKWAYRDAINAAQTDEELDQIHIEFYYLNFAE